MLARLTLLFAACALAACASVPDQRHVASPWDEAFVAPTLISTPRMRLEPLQPKFNQLDYDAAQASADHLRTTLQWGSWPSPDMTADQNRGDLERHWREFQQREAYAYTVLHPSGSPCIGCVYLNPDKQDARTLRMAYWVTADQLASHLDTHLVDTVLGTIAATWPTDTVVITHPQQNPRGIQILSDRGLERIAEEDGKVTFAFRR